MNFFPRDLFLLAYPVDDGLPRAQYHVELMQLIQLDGSERGELS